MGCNAIGLNTQISSRSVERRTAIDQNFRFTLSDVDISQLGGLRICVETYASRSLFDLPLTKNVVLECEFSIQQRFGNASG